MRKLIGAVATALLVVASLGLSVAPASAEPSEWAFGFYPVNLHPGSTIAGGTEYLRTVPPNAIIGPTSRFNPVGDEAVTRLVVAMSACGNDPGYSMTVLDGSGFVRSSTQATRFGQHQITVEATPEVGPGVDRRILPPPAPTPGPRWLRVTCLQSETTPALVVACVRFTVDPSAPETWSPVEGGTYRDDPCPGPGRILGDLLGSWLEVVIPRFFEGLSPGSAGSDPSTTSTTRAPSGAAPGGSGAPGGGGGGGAADTTAPVVDMNYSGTLEACAVLSVGAYVTDDVGVTSATVSWSGAYSGSAAMSGGGTSWSADIGPFGTEGGTLALTVTARDAAGNEGSDVNQFDLTQC